MSAVAQPLQSILDNCSAVAKATKENPLYLTANFAVTDNSSEATFFPKLILELQLKIRESTEAQDLPLARKVFALLKIISLQSKDFSQGVNVKTFEKVILNTVKFAEDILNEKRELKELKSQISKGTRSHIFHLGGERSLLRDKMTFLTSLKELVNQTYVVAYRKVEFIQILNNAKFESIRIWGGSSPPSQELEEKEESESRSIDLVGSEEIAFYFRWFKETDGKTCLRIKNENVKDFKNRYFNHSNLQIRKLAEYAIFYRSLMTAGLLFQESFPILIQMLNKASYVKNGIGILNLDVPSPLLEFVDPDSIYSMATTKASKDASGVPEEPLAQACLQTIRTKLVPCESTLNLLYTILHRDQNLEFPGKKIIPKPKEMPLFNPEIMSTGELLSPERFSQLNLVPASMKVKVPQKKIVGMEEMSSSSSSSAASDPTIELFKTSAYPKGIVYHPRCHEWFLDPKAAFSRDEYKNIQSETVKERIRLFHAFSTQIDSLVGTCYSKKGEWVNSATGKANIRYSIPVQVTLNGQILYASIDYTFDSNTGVCYHRCISEKDIERFLSAWYEFDFPTLQKSAKILEESSAGKRMEISKMGALQFEGDSQTVVIQDGPMTIRAFMLGDD